MSVLLTLNSEAFKGSTNGYAGSQTSESSLGLKFSSAHSIVFMQYPSEYTLEKSVCSLIGPIPMRFNIVTKMATVYIKNFW